MPGVFEPLVPQSAIDPFQKWLEQRRQDQSPLEAQLKGFGAGALEGLRGLTSPAELATMIPGAAAGKLLKFVPRAAKAVGPTLDVLEDLPVKQVMPSADDVSALIGSMRHNLAKVPQKGMRPQAPGRPNFPEFAPTDAPTASGPVQGLKRAVDPVHDQMFKKYVSR